MYQKEDAIALAGRLKEAALAWANRKIDELAAGRPRIKAVSVYLKRGLANWLEREDKRIFSMVDGLALFVADKDGHIDTDMLVNDVATMFREMEVRHVEVRGFGIDYGQGAITVDVPHNLLFDLLLGDLGRVMIKTEDLLELRELLSTRY